MQKVMHAGRTYYVKGGVVYHGADITKLEDAVGWRGDATDQRLKARILAKAG